MSSKKLQPVSIILASVLAIGLMAYALWHPAQEGDEILSQQELVLSKGEPGDFEPENAETNSIEPPGILLSARPRGANDDSVQRKLAPSQVSIGHNVVMEQYKSELWDEIQTSPPELRRPGDPDVDADMAYRLYMYFGNCAVVLSRRHQFDQQIEKIANRAEHANRSFLENLESRLDEMIDYHELCLPIPPDMDARMQAVIWMSKAVRLGHEIAEVQFYQKAMGFMMRPDPSTNSPPLAMQHPGLIADFKATARLGLARALKKGHPEAWLAKSQAILEGLIYPKDPLLAYAYARKAELEAEKNHMIVREISARKEQAARYLSQEQLAEAGQLAFELNS